MKSSKKFKVDQVINSLLLEIDDDFDDDEEVMFDEKPTVKGQKTPLKSIENQIHVKKQTPIKIKQIIHEESNSSDDIPLGVYAQKKMKVDTESESSDNDDIPLAVLKSKKKPDSESDDDDDLPLSILVSEKKGVNSHENFRKLMNLKIRLGEFDRKYEGFKSRLLDNSCVFLKGILDFRDNEYSGLKLNENCSSESSFVDDSDYEDESKVPTSPVLKLETNYVLTVKNLKRKSFY